MKRKTAGTEDDQEPSRKQQEILELVEKAEVVEALDAAGLKKELVLLERRINANQELRAKHSDEPERFVDSEVELDESLKRLHVLATAPDLLPEFVRLGATSSLLSLLGHENDDIAADVVSLLRELTEPADDAEDAAAAEAPAGAFFDELLRARAPSLLVQNLSRIPESDDSAQVIHDTLALIENMIEARPAPVRDALSSDGAFVSLLLARTRMAAESAGPVDDAGGYACELLSILLHGNEQAQRRLGEHGAVEQLLHTASALRRRDPSTPEEEEFFENAFDSLCSLLLVPENQGRFDDAEGTNLMLIVIKAHGFASLAALRVLDFQLSNNPAGCIAFIEALGLKTLFPLLARGLKASKRSRALEREVDEHVVSCILSLFKYLESGERRSRLLGKFTEEGCEKVDRLVEMHEKYDALVRAADRASGGGDEEDEEQRFLDRLDAGLFLLQSIDLVLAHAALSDPVACEHARRTLSARSIAPSSIEERIREYIGQAADAEKRMCSSLLDCPLFRK